MASSDDHTNDLLDRMGATPAQRAWAERMCDQLMNPLRHIICPLCSIRFGMEANDMAFTEQTGSTVFCPRGHEMTLVKGE